MTEQNPVPVASSAQPMAISAKTSHNSIVKEQLLHILFGTVIFLVLAVIAVGLDLASAGLDAIPVGAFTRTALSWSSHGILIVDLVLFAVYMVTSSAQLIKEMLK